MERMSRPASAVTQRESGRVGEREGDRVSFEPFFEAEHTKLLRALYLLTGNAQEAEEIMQDTFVAVWERWDRVGAMENPVGYLYRAAMNRFRSRARRATRAARVVLGSMQTGDAFAAADERDAVARALAALPERQRAAIVLTELLGYGSDEAGEILGVRGVTVRSLASQARSTLRTVLEERDG
jgi:RNA polymerase sigma factor (sigma-70 family)